MPIPKIKINGTWTPIVTIPTTLSSFTNDVGYIVSSEVDNIFVQSSAPSSANNGDLWVDTTNSELKVKQSGGWTSLGGGLTATSPLNLTSGVISLSSGYGDTQNPYGTKAANYVLAGPSSGSASAPTFRALVADDIPDLGSVASQTTANLTVSDTEPSTPSVGDVWIDTSNSGIPMANGVDF